MRIYLTIKELENVIKDVKETKNRLIGQNDVLEDIVAITVENEKVIFSHPRLSDATKDYKQYLNVD